METKKLVNGQEMPVLGLGCYKSQGTEAYRAVRWAAEAGYRHVDTAAFYRNEEEVGRAVTDCGVPREEMFVVTKIWPTEFDRPNEAIEDCVRRLHLDCADLLLLHWPGTDETLRFRAYEAALAAVERGLVRGAGVSNFLPHHLEGLSARFGVPPATDQIELNPLYQQRETAAYCKAHGIAVTAWGPLVRGKLASCEGIASVAERVGRTPAQVTLRWHLQHGNVVIPKSVHRERIEENAAIFDFALSEADMAELDALECNAHSSNDPDTFTGR